MRRAGWFVLTGCVGFVVDAALLLALRRWMWLIEAQAIAYMVAMIVTFSLNRAITFQASSCPAESQGLRYVVSALIGAMVVNGIYVVAVLCGIWPLAALSFGAGASAVVSYFLMARWVFRVVR
jgi:putative flippase GtrA